MSLGAMKKTITKILLTLENPMSFKVDEIIAMERTIVITGMTTAGTTEALETTEIEIIAAIVMEEDEMIAEIDPTAMIITGTMNQSA